MVSNNLFELLLLSQVIYSAEANFLFSYVLPMFFRSIILLFFYYLYYKQIYSGLHLEGPRAAALARPSGGSATAQKAHDTILSHQINTSY